MGARGAGGRRLARAGPRRLTRGSSSGTQSSASDVCGGRGPSRCTAAGCSARWRPGGRAGRGSPRRRGRRRRGRRVRRRGVHPRPAGYAEAIVSLIHERDLPTRLAALPQSLAARMMRRAECQVQCTAARATVARTACSRSSMRTFGTSSQTFGLWPKKSKGFAGFAPSVRPAPSLRHRQSSRVRALAGRRMVDSADHVPAVFSGLRPFLDWGPGCGCGPELARNQ